MNESIIISFSSLGLKLIQCSLSRNPAILIVFDNRTANLADSYVWAVYFMGKIQGSGYLWNNREATTESIYHHTKINGRKLAEEFVKRYKAENFKGWEIVWAATAPYSVILESGSSNRNRFFVLSNMYDEIASDFKGRAIIELKKNI